MSNRLAPTVDGKPLLGNLYDMQRNPLEFLLRAQRTAGDVVRLRFGPVTTHLITNPDHVKTILVDRARNFTKQTRPFAVIRRLIGNGLLASEGSFWRRQRRIASPAFKRKAMVTFEDAMVSGAQTTAERWQNVANSGRELDVASEMMELTLRIVGQTLLSADVTLDAPDVGHAISFLLVELRRRMFQILPVPDRIPTQRNRKYLKSKAAIDRIIKRIIAERRQNGESPDDLLSMLMDATDEETGERMTDAQLRDEVVTMFIAGHETTAIALTWAWHLLSSYPPAYRRLVAELNQVLCDRPVTIADLPKLPYLRAVLDETMRLYPPAWMIGRHVAVDEELGGFRIPAGTMVDMSPYVIHRHPDLWPDPMGFDPERFLGKSTRHRFAYIPFGAGAHICIGKHFALIEAQLVLATLARRFHLSRVPASSAEIEPAITLRPKGSIEMRVQTW